MDKKFIAGFFKISIPVIITQLLANLVNTTDTIMLGEITDLAISGVAVANKVFFVFQLTMFGLTNGVGLFISQYYGAEKKAYYNNAFRLGLILCVSVASLFALIVYCNSEFITCCFVKNQVTIEYCQQYLKIIVFTFVPFAISQMCSVVYRVTGMTSVVMYGGFITFAVNIVGNLLLISGVGIIPRLEVLGAAIATLLARVFEMLYYAIYVNQKESKFRLEVKYSFLEKERCKQIVLQSIPLVANEFIWSIGLSFIMVNYAYVDEYYLSALSVVDNISNLVFVAFSGCAAVAGVYIGSNLGANQISLAKNNSVKLIVLSLAIYFVGGVIIFLNSDFFPSLYHIEGELLEKASIFLKIKSMTAWTQGYSNTIYNILRAGGDTKSILVLDGLYTCFGPVLISFVGSHIFQFDIVTLFLIVESMGIIKVLIASHYYRKGKWLQSLV